MPIKRKALKLNNFLKAPQTLGDHIKAVRLARKLTQESAAREIGVTAGTILHWERNDTNPRVKDIPAILQFLEYNPLPQGVTLSERMLAFRRVNGLSYKEASTLCKLHWETWRDWEFGKNKKWWPSTRHRLEHLLDLEGNGIDQNWPK